MTRVNLIHPEQLCDQHLLAEHREIKRIPNCIYKYAHDIPESYRLGPGHVKFFLDKQLFLYKRYKDIYTECLKRGFKVNWLWPSFQLPQDLWNDHKPTPEAIQLNLDRIIERLPKNARWTSTGLLIETEEDY